jgi:HAD superfamily hydrolase (TIGR01549 family)
VVFRLKEGNLNTQRTQGIIFDLDGTLYQMKFMKIKMTVRLLRSLVFLRQLSAARSVVRQNRFGGRADLLATFYSELASRTGKSVQQSQNWYENDFYRAFIQVLARWAEPRAGLTDLLGKLRQSGLKLAVVSDFGRIIERLEALRIDPALFDIIKSSEDCGALKPAPESFLSVARIWGFPPQEILVVGDRKDRDGEGAHHAGMPFLGITDKRNTRADFYSWKDALIKLELTTNCGVNV